MTLNWQSWCTSIGDLLCGWMLHLPRDVALALLILFSAGLMLIIRRLLADQSLLRLAAADLRTLRQLRRTARAAGDDETVARCRRTRGLVFRKKLKGERLSILVSLLPLSVLFVWGTARLDSLPPNAGEPLRLEARVNAAAAGEVIHLVPVDGIRVEGGWIRQITQQRGSEFSTGVAQWDFTADEKITPYKLSLRFRNEAATHLLSVGGPVYPLERQNLDGEIETRVELNPYRPLGFVGGFAPLGLPAWAIAYFIGTAIHYFGGRRMLGIY